jgi:hypothetical protein
MWHARVVRRTLFLGRSNAMDDAQERAYVIGQRQVWASLLAQCVRQLGAADWPHARLVKEREDTIAMLRQICARYGDNEWEPELYLADIVASHLWNHLDAKE